MSKRPKNQWLSLSEYGVEKQFNVSSRNSPGRIFWPLDPAGKSPYGAGNRRNTASTKSQESVGGVFSRIICTDML
jgi:hypothetical protein